MGLLIQYKGGGYDGCFWEYNYCYYDHANTFHSIAASGYRGCKNEEEWLDYQAHADKGDSTLYAYDEYNLNNPTDRQRFVREAPISHLLGVAKWLEDEVVEDNEQPLMATCDGCDTEWAVADMVGTGIRGCGGIAMEYTALVCPYCHEAEEED